MFSKSHMNFTKTFHAQGMEKEENENTLQYFLFNSLITDSLL